MENSKSPAFPNEKGAGINHPISGLTKREYFAIKIAQGLRASNLYRTSMNPMEGNTLWTSEDIAALSIRDAEELLKQLESK